MSSTTLKALRPIRSGLRAKQRNRSLYSNLFSGKFRNWENSRRLYSDSSNIVKSQYHSVELPNKPLHEFVLEGCASSVEKVAIECVVTGKKFKYDDIINHTKGIAIALQKKFKLTKGDTQAIALPNCPEYPCIFLGGSMAGVVTTTVNPMYTPVEISYQVSLLEPKILFTTPATYEKCVEVLNILKLNIPIVVVKMTKDSTIPEGGVDYNELVTMTGELEPVPFNFDDDVVVPISSGTSGRPKGVQLSHRNIIANLLQFQYNNAFKNRSKGGSGQTVSLGVLPMYHIYGMVVITLDGLANSTQLIVNPKFDPKLLVESIYRKKIQILFLAPPIISFLANNSNVKRKYLSYVKYIVNGAAPLPVADIDKLLKKAPSINMCQGYGMTETSPVITFSHFDRYYKVASVGHPVNSTEIKVTDLKTKKALPKFTSGEIWVKGPQVMKSYYKNPEETEKTFEDGWLKTGDIGYYDEDHDFFIVDRMKELIKVKGFQVAPAELEDVLKGHPAVADVGVIGIHHPTQGEAPRAYVVLKKNVSATEDDIKNFIKHKLSPYKQLLGGVRFIDEIPKSNAGKILRRELKIMAENEKKR